jgi:hypothetical protein
MWTTFDDFDHRQVLPNAKIIRVSQNSGLFSLDLSPHAQRQKHSGNSMPDVSPNLAASQHELIRDVIIRMLLNSAQMADATGCSPSSIKAIRLNLHSFATPES